MYLFELVVSGGGDFPIDMLRYERAFPATEKDANLIEQTFDPFTYPGLKTVTLHAYKSNRKGENTGARWRSFGWSLDSWKLLG